jgi:hypothetical protein
MCFPDGEFQTGEADILLGELPVPGLDRPVPFWMSRSQYEYWKHTHLTVDVVPGRGSGFSVEAPDGVRFLIRSRLLTEAELDHFRLGHAVLRGPGRHQPAVLHLVRRRDHQRVLQLPGPPRAGRTR